MKYLSHFGIGLGMLLLGYLIAKGMSKKEIQKAYTAGVKFAESQAAAAGTTGKPSGISGEGEDEANAIDTSGDIQKLQMY